MSNIWEYYGGSSLALKGKNCTLLISDKRLGKGSITTSTAFNRIHQITPYTYVCLPSFIPDSQKLVSLLIKNKNLFKYTENRYMSPQEISALLSYMLYDKRFMNYITDPIVAGVLGDTPYICGMDSLGCMNDQDNFVAAGTAYTNLIGGCEAVFTENLEPEQLFEVGTKLFLSAIERDALSGWGVETVLITPGKVVKRRIKGRMD
ncbi:hypothetical protein H311_01588 [Anncaliia algerae PRA109]|nr:hypothetical protein H311_03585 [Anncaliia algerae PRA109]KCZ77403.1 hypothetical protein H311_01588 [Anncaliia algerae PRA109]